MFARAAQGRSRSASDTRTCHFLDTSTPIKLPVAVPYLKPDGTNWSKFSTCFRKAMQVTQRWDYFDGITPRPVPKDAREPTEGKSEVMA